MNKLKYKIIKKEFIYANKECKVNHWKITVKTPLGLLIVMQGALNKNDEIYMPLVHEAIIEKIKEKYIKLK